MNNRNGVQCQGTADSEVYCVCPLNAVSQKVIQPPMSPQGQILVPLLGASERLKGQERIAG